MAETGSGGTGTRTILFTDLVGSTALRSVLGDVAADEVWREHERLLRDAIARHGGVFAQDLGDGLMAVFESATDGCACAVAMQQGIGRLRRRRGVELSMRVGLSAGDVALDGDDWSGMPVVEAARLEAAAAGDQILASELVRLLAGTRTEASFEPVGELNLKGLASPVAACAIRWEPLADVSVLPLPPALRASGFGFVGRESELDTLMSMWESARAGGVRGALAAGDAGIGKTRLAAEFAAQVHAKGAIVLTGRCDEDLAVPYQPFVEALRYLVDQGPDDLVSRLGRYPGELPRLVPELTTRVADLPPALQADPGTERYRLFEAIGSWLAAASADDPLLLVLDDLQWATKPTTLLLRHLLRAEAPSRLLILGTYRSTDVHGDDPLSELLADLHRGTDVERVTLDGLEESGVAALLADALARPLTAVETDLAGRIHEETAGNAFFASEVVRHIGEVGVRADTVAVPDSVREVVGRRLALLSDDANDVLVAAAVLGAEFELDDLTPLTARAQAEVIGALEEASASRLLEESALNHYRFAHALVRTTIYDGLSQTRRARLHRQVAETIEARFAADLDERAVAIAYHLGEVARGDPTAAPGALAYAQRAGDHALVRLAPEEAASHYGQALDLLAALPPDPERRCDLLLALGSALLWAADFPAARDAYWSAADLARELHDGRRMAAAAIGYRGPPRTASDRYQPHQVALLEDALAMLDEREPALSSLIHAYLSRTVLDPGSANEHCAHAVRLARGIDDPVVVCNALFARAAMMFTPETAGEQLSITTEALDVARRSESPDLRLQAVGSLLVAASQLDDHGGLLEVISELREIAERFHQPFHLATIEQLKARRLISCGELEDAERRSTAAVSMASDDGTAIAYFGQLMLIRGLQGRAKELLNGAVLEVDPSGDPAALTLHLVMVLLHAQADRRGEAQQAFDAILDDDFNALAIGGAWTRYRQLELALLAEICVRLDDGAAAARLHPLLVPYDGLHVHAAAVAYSGPFALYLGMLESVLEHYDDAVAHLESARNYLEQTGAYALELRARAELGFAVASASDSGKERGYQLLQSARDEAEEMGLVDVARCCDDLMLRLRP